MHARSAAALAEVIRSRQNSQLKTLRRHLLDPAHSNDGQIAIEGEHLVREAMRSRLRIGTLFVREDWAERADWSACGAALTMTVGVDAFNYACVTEAPQGVAALIEAPRWTLDERLQTKDALLLVLDGLQDPGNLGTIIRSAEAFGAACILLTPGTVHPWNQKVLRASAGSSFRLPVIPLKSESAIEQLREIGIPMLAAAAHAGVSIQHADIERPVAFVIGNEGAGISQAVLRFCSGTIHIPCSGPVESLNAAVAASILLYEASLRYAGGRNL
jgi:RNA methyltransferase, TrmH family